MLLTSQKFKLPKSSNQKILFVNRTKKDNTMVNIKRTNNDLQNATQKNNEITIEQHKSHKNRGGGGGELEFSERVGS